jgi:protein-L-isoaspartate(D-aspartate) O-methyltransferase
MPPSSNFGKSERAIWKKDVRENDASGDLVVDRLQAQRIFFSDFITASAGIPKSDRRLADAFASVPRERFVGPGPWKIFTSSGLLETPSDDPAFLYQDVTVSLAADRHINNGQPLLHAICLAALKLAEGHNVLHIGAGTGYYTAILSKLVGSTGSILAYEIEQDLAQRATINLRDYPNVTVYHRSGSLGPLPDCDAIYVNAGATAPLDVWLDALRLSGRLLFPLTPSDSPCGAPGAGAMLLISRPSTSANPGEFHAQFVSSAIFINCTGARDEGTARKLSAAFKRGNYRNVRSFYRNAPPDETCWFAGNNWWLSTREIAPHP